MPNELKIFCIIPAYNEENHIVKVIEEVKRFIDEIVVVDDNSSDNTYDLAKSQGITVLKHIINRNQGAALQTGNDYALQNGADIIVHFDADGQFVAEEIEDVINPLINGDYDIVFGSRFLEKKSKIPFLKKNVIMPLARLVNLIFFGVKLTDPQSGFRAMNRLTAEKIQITQDGKAHCSEILAKAYQKNLRIKEVPTSVIYNEFGQKFSGGVSIIKNIIISKLID